VAVPRRCPWVHLVVCCGVRQSCRPNLLQSTLRPLQMLCAFEVALGIVCVADATISIQKPDTQASLGHIYALTSNGTTNLLNVVDVDLTTWEMAVGPSLGASYDTFGQAAL
jgi:hypothetical protein